ncbi:S1 family peptidase [Paenibacillaceae bacterium WGS1546]|uniref:S1 family peptidase n=1 Tax=Cohnella sp. WGS1546 TaxID=3366810 RepID=UPI00372D3160
MMKKKVTIICTVMTFTILVFIFSNFPDGNVFANENHDLTKKSIEFRLMFGLDLNSDALNAVKQQAYYSNTFGVLMTEAEEKILEERLEYQDRNIPILKKTLNSNKYKDNFGIIYIDQQKGGVINIGFKNVDILTPADIESIVSSYGHRDQIRIFKTNITEEELERLHETILNEQTSLIDNYGIEITDINTNIFTQTIEVGVKNIDEYKVTILKNQFGTINIEYQPSAQIENHNRSSTYTTLQGGLTIVNSNTGGSCTYGFSIKSTSSNPIYYAVTAGHCGEATPGAYHSFKQGSNNIGTAIRKVYSGSVDAMVIGTNSALTYSNKVYTTVAGRESFVLTQPKSDATIGEAVKMSGKASNSVNTGVLQTKNLSYSIGGSNFSNLWGASYSSISGDSGAPVYNNYVLKGINKGTYTNVSGTTYGVYSHVENIMNVFNNNGTCSCYVPVLN